MGLAGFRISENVPRPDHPGQAQRARLEPRRGEDRVVELFPAENHHELQPVAIDRNDGAFFAAVFSFFVGVDGVDSRIPGENGFVVGVDERRDMRARKTLAQGEDERRGADEIADVVAADDQDARVRALSGHGR